VKRSQKGFAVLESLLILVIVAMVAGTGWYTWHAKNRTDKILSEASNTTQTVKASNSTTTLRLAEGQITLNPRNIWKTASGGYYSVQSGICGQGVTVTPQPKCVDYAMLIPSGETFTNPDQFRVDIAVFDRTDMSGAADWLKGIEGGLIDNPQITTLTINGKDAARWLAVNPGGDTVTYVTYGIVSSKYGVLIGANAFYGSYYSYKNTANVDYRTYLPKIDTLVQTLKIAS